MTHHLINNDRLTVHDDNDNDDITTVDVLLVPLLLVLTAHAISRRLNIVGRLRCGTHQRDIPIMFSDSSVVHSGVHLMIKLRDDVCPLCRVWYFLANVAGVMYGGTENARPENMAQSKLQDWKTRNRKTRHRLAGRVIFFDALTGAHHQYSCHSDHVM